MRSPIIGISEGSLHRVSRRAVSILGPRRKINITNRGQICLDRNRINFRRSIRTYQNVVTESFKEAQQWESRLFPSHPDVDAVNERRGRRPFNAWSPARRRRCRLGVRVRYLHPPFPADPVHQKQIQTERSRSRPMHRLLQAVP